MQDVNNFIIEHLSHNNWHFAFINYDFKKPDKSLIWFESPVVAHELPRNIFFPKSGYFSVLAGIVPHKLFENTGGVIDNKSVLRLMLMVSPDDIKAVAYGETHMDFDVISVHDNWKDQLNGQGQSYNVSVNG